MNPSIFTSGRLLRVKFFSLQLCYNRADNEHILRWSEKEGYLRARVDAPEDKPGRAMSALLATDGIFPANLVREDFLKAAPEIPDEVRDFVLSRIAGYPA